MSDKINGSKVIVNLATGRYVAGQTRLATSLANVGYDGQFLAFQKESSIGAPPHNQNPYAFKIHGFRRAEQLGHRFVLWLDASVWAIRDVQPVFDHIEEHGHIMQYAGHNCGRWSNDRCLEYFDITRDEAENMLMYGNAGFLGLDLWDTRATAFLHSWEKAMKAGIFKGAWHNKQQTESKDPRCAGHRHDMVVGSIIANKLNMEYQKGGDWLAYARPEETVRDTVIFKAMGIA